MRYINYNGNIFPEHETLLTVGNRGFKYGEGFFESIVMFNKRMPLLDYHWSRIEFTAEVLSTTLPNRLDMESLENQILDLASVNDGLKNGRIRVQFFRKGEGLYLPDSLDLGYTITMDKIENSRFECGDGLIAGVREDCYKPVSMTSDIKSTSALTYVVAAQFAKKEGWDEILLLNHYGHICEAVHANVIVVKGEKLITPDLDSGCVNGVMRSYLISMLEGQLEEREIEGKELEEIDEILLTNAVKGIQWVKSFGGRTLRNKKAVELTALLNKNLLGMISS